MQNPRMLPETEAIPMTIVVPQRCVRGIVEYFCNECSLRVIRASAGLMGCLFGSFDFRGAAE